MNVKEAVEEMRRKDPILTDLFAALVIAKRENDEPIAQAVIELIKLHKETKNNE